MQTHSCMHLASNRQKWKVFLRQADPSAAQRAASLKSPSLSSSCRLRQSRRGRQASLFAGRWEQCVFRVVAAFVSSPRCPFTLSPVRANVSTLRRGRRANTVSSLAVKIKKPIKTKFRMPVFNWVALKPNQINGTVFNEIDDERILEVELFQLTKSTSCFLLGHL